MKVSVVDWRGWEYGIITIEISDYCPVCGSKRGEPYDYMFSPRNGEYGYCHKWNNPCGHIDEYEDLIKEASI